MQKILDTTPRAPTRVPRYRLISTARSCDREVCAALLSPGSSRASHLGLPVQRRRVTGRPLGQDSMILHQADFNHAYLTRFTPCSNTKYLILLPFLEFVWFFAPVGSRGAGAVPARLAGGGPPAARPRDVLAAGRGAGADRRADGAVTSSDAVLRGVRGWRPAPAGSRSEHGTTG